MRVLDFGIAAALRSEAVGDVVEELGETLDLDVQGSQARASLATMTRPGTLLGTLPYMASEQLAGRRADARSDQHALCVALWEALVGQRPFAGRSPEALLRGIAAGPDPGVLAPRWLRAILVRGLADDPRRRWPDMHALVAAIERGARGQRLRRIAALLVATAALVMAGIGGYRVVARAAAEARAEGRLEVLRGQLAGLRARGDQAGAAQLLRSFVEFPDNRDTAAPARAHREWGEAQTDDAAAIDAYASAYVAAQTAADEGAALRGLVRRLYAGGALEESAAALAVLSREDAAAREDPTLARPRLAAALHRRDFAAASAALASGPAAERGWIPILEALSRVTVHPLERFTGDGKPVLYMEAADLDGDGRAEVVTNCEGPDREVTVVRAEPSLPVWGRLRWPDRAHLVLPLDHALGGEGLLLSSHPVGARARLQLSRVVDGAAVAVASWEEEDESAEIQGVTADLDGDGALELYVGSGPYARRLSRFDRGPGGWTRSAANLATDAARSDLQSIAAGDLDGDGRGELVVAAGPWTAYDLRVLRARAGARAGVEDSLELVARRSFGSIVKVVLPRTRGGRRIAFVKNDATIAPGRFPADQPTGAAPGLYVAELRGEAIEVIEHVPTPPSWRESPSFERVLVGDLDGDGEDELVCSLRPSAGMVLLRWHEGRLSAPLVVTGLVPLLVHDLDGDGRAEIVATDLRDHDRVVVFGAGDEVLAVTPVTDQARAVPERVTDPAVAGAWRRAEELAAIGVPRRSADELVTLARIAGHVPEDMLMRAAELYEATGADALAAENYLAAAARPGLAERALAGAIRSRRKLGEFAAAAGLVAARGRLPGLAVAERAANEAERAALERAAARRPELRFAFAEALDPMWRVDDPLAVRRDPERRALSVWSTRTPVAADYPIAWDGGPLTLEVDLEIDRVESSNEVTIGLAAAGEETPWVALRVVAWGASAAPRVAVMSASPGRLIDFTAAGPGLRLRARVTIVPELATGIDEFEASGQRERKVFALPTRPPVAGPLRLVIGGSEALWTAYTGRVWVHEIRIAGVTAGARVDAGSPAARMLAEHDFVAAAGALVDASAGPELLWRAEALAGQGRVEEAAVVIAAVPEDSPEFAALTHRLRRDRDALTLAARAGLGSRWIDVVGHGGRARAVDELAALTDWPERRGGPAADATPEERGRHTWALVLRGRAQLAFGHLDEAGRDLADAAAAVADEGHALPERELQRDAVAEAQVGLAVARGDRVALREALGRMLVGSPIAEIKLERLMSDPQIRGQLGADEWAALQREHRAR